ncbi:rod shape-determining protein MreC [Williamwhitmania taraxaci]|uniref:Cell shape-determining protein MreC n=1 Tax=Williamwhitmania taraxaci TaxID=1640674 RepID=A0A1G6HZT5_9BACT|nr:rod shape-determining protein MreC [Williamwhitmania taraxaci]SDB99724.1 rod shape-determining protein MreC [Williamwhitmania taraxaci]
MNSLIRFLFRYHIIFLFVFLEVIALVLISSDSLYQRYRMVSAARSVSGALHDWVGGISDYVDLRDQNDILVRENLNLRRKLADYGDMETNIAPYVPDTLLQDTAIKVVAQYHYYSAKVVSNSVNKQHNFITIKAGTSNGVRPQMGVITSNGLVGVVKSCSKNYSTVISLLNTDLKVSAKLRRTGYFGSFAWDGISQDIVILSEIPQNADVVVGDTVVTSGYSSMFPEGIMLGFIKDFDMTGGSFYRIRVKLSSEFQKLNYVYLVDNVQSEEQTQLESIDIKND